MSDIKKIKDKHNKYYEYLFENDMNSLAKLFSYPALFKGFVSEVQIAKNEKGEPLSQATVQTYLSPNRTDKDPNNDIKVRF